MSHDSSTRSTIDIPALLAALPARIADIPALAAARDPQHVALIEDARRLTSAQLLEAVNATAAQLREWGVRGGDRVMIVAENSIVQIVLLFATAQLDAWALVSNARLSAAELDAIRAHAQPRVVAYAVESSVDAQQHARRLQAVTAPAITPDIGAWSYTVDPDAKAEPVEGANDRQCAALIYTTGTTGAPKGVMLSHRNLLFIAAISSRLRKVGPDDVVYAVLPISHVYGFASVCLGSLHAGATLRLAPRFAPEAVRRALAEERVSIFQGVPAMHAKLLEHLQTHGHAWSAPRLRFAYSGGSPLDAALKAHVESVYGLPLHNGYGMTESSPTVSHTMLDAPRSDCSVGEVIPGVDVRFVGLDGVDAAPGEIGELWVRGPNVMLGYYRSPEQTRAVVTEDGWLKTGDLARQDADGALHIVGRSKELIIRSGFNVYPAEVEHVLNAHPQVVQSAVIGRAVEGNEEVVAFVELIAGATVTPAELIAWCGERLAPYKRPADVKVLAALPAASTGKILKHRLREFV
ncbi:Long-chain-fatty-acid--CoA ligase [Paraburkholderia nemoris]|uniref:class I adenylate-forming enzyme family protein n=1 Tax=Paraburkholderia nemoris TaxID=2793076 RepID=UPI00190A7FBA|nr:MULTISPECIES: AMP-binding protein [Paraburkholderia]MBK3782016.1 long-chain fatty acid--CoA ligase [Paraburkholderia aspalathi]CAE6734262.1 Long-chain-fatty-acid--CoA ligase [Paraburkholderia nemoris]